MPEYAVNDTTTITQRIKEIRCTEQRRCYKKAELSSINCWCMGSAEGGGNQPCTAAIDVD